MTEEKYKRAALLKDALARLNYDLSCDYFEKANFGDLAIRFLTEEEILQLRMKIKARAAQRLEELKKQFDEL